MVLQAHYPTQTQFPVLLPGNMKFLKPEPFVEATLILNATSKLLHTSRVVSGTAADAKATDQNVLLARSGQA